MNSAATVLPTPDLDAGADFLLPLPDPAQRLDPRSSRPTRA